MSNKNWDKINPLDQLIRKTLSYLGMSDGTFLKIEFIWGFEKFNTRPYHNYETWAGGYRVTDEKNNICLEREDLDDALILWADIVKRLRAGEEIHWSKRYYNIIPKEQEKIETKTVEQVSPK